MKTWLAYPGQSDRCETDSEVIDTLLRKGWTIIPAPPEPPPSPPPPPAWPPVVTIGALRIAMGRDVCIAIGAWIQAITDVHQRHEAMSWWEYQPYVRRDHPVVEQFRLALGRTTAEVDVWFAAAKQLDSM